MRTATLELGKWYPVKDYTYLDIASDVVVAEVVGKSILTYVAIHKDGKWYSRGKHRELHYIHFSDSAMFTPMPFETNAAGEWKVSDRFVRVDANETYSSAVLKETVDIEKYRKSGSRSLTLDLIKFINTTRGDDDKS